MWPLPALAAWAACWAVHAGGLALGAPPWLAAGSALVLGVLLAIGAATPWRRFFMAIGFPLSLAASGLAGGLPAWLWLAPLGALVFVYPVGAWRDAPMFPTARGTLAGLGRRVVLAPGAAILDAGCGLGDALGELHREYPQASFHGIEKSSPLALAARWRCRFARVRRGDMWADDWSRFDLVYLFQRPESMARAAAKAARELREGAWLASLEFEIEGLRASRTLPCGKAGRQLWLYRAPFTPR